MRCPTTVHPWTYAIAPYPHLTSIHGGQMWEVRKMQGAIFRHGHVSFEKAIFYSEAIFNRYKASYGLFLHSR